VFEQPMSYVCEKSVGPGKSCDFRSGKVILQQPIERAQMEKLLSSGRTDVLRAFVSNRTRRKFSAFLAKKPDGTIGFEFEPRPAKAGGVAKTPRKAAKATEPDAGYAAAPAKAAKRSAGKTTATAADAKPAKAATKRPTATTRTTTAARKTTARKTAARKTAAKSAAKAGGAGRKSSARS
jgi:DNA topoisomerase-3